MRRRWWVALVVLLVLVAAGGASGFMARTALEPVSPGATAPVVLTVRHDEAVAQVIDQLARDRLIRSPFWFGLYGIARSLPSRLHPGRFVLDRGMAASEVIAVLEGPSVPAPIRVTIPEGLTTRAIARRLAGTGLFTAAAYLQAVHQAGLAGLQPLPGTPRSLGWVGLCFGDTYDVAPHTSAAAFLQLQVADFNRRLRPAVLQGAAAVHLTPYQVVILGSIVSAEAARPRDQRLVAGVFLNRLARGMPLQSDPTVAYAEERAGRSGFSVTFPSPYNTYLHRGLPPGPIDNPGMAAVLAVLHPIHSAYLYFVSLRNGRILYSVTAAQHRAQVQQAAAGG